MPLSLAAFDIEDLAVISAHLQDARLVVRDALYIPDRMRFVMAFHRKCREAPPAIDGRCHSGMHFERVLSVQNVGFDSRDKERILDLLAITFEPGRAPAGTVLLHFAGGEAIKVEVECLEALMKDLDEMQAVPGGSRAA